MSNLTPLGWIFLAWGIVTALLALVLIYRSIVSMKEDDQLFLDATESHFEKEQQGILSRLALLRPYIKGLVVASGGLLLTMAVIIAYRIVNL